MMPAMKLNTPPVTSSQPPHSSAAAALAQGDDPPEPPDGLKAPVTSSPGPWPRRSVRTDRQLSHIRVASAISAAGSSQLTWPPMSAANSLVRPAELLKEGPAPPRNPTEPVSLPSSRPRPLQPSASCSTLLLVEPPI